MVAIKFCVSIFSSRCIMAKNSFNFVVNNVKQYIQQGIIAENKKKGQITYEPLMMSYASNGESWDGKQKKYNQNIGYKAGDNVNV